MAIIDDILAQLRPYWDKLAAEAGLDQRVKTIAEVREDLEDDLKIGIPQRRVLIDQVKEVFKYLYVHRKFKLRRHAVDIVQALEVLQRKTDLSGRAFHDELMTIVKSLNDTHTSYSAPGLRSKIAFLPFIVAQYFDRDRDKDRDPRRYVVTRMLGDCCLGTFASGVEITKWNGVPIQIAVERNAEREDGPNVAARQALGVQFLTMRWLGATLLPDEEWVIVGYRQPRTKENGDKAVEQPEEEIRIPWGVLDVGRNLVAAQQALTELQNRGEHACYSPRMQVEHAMRKRGFKKTFSQDERPFYFSRQWVTRDVDVKELDENANEIKLLPPCLEVRKIRHGQDPWIGHIRIRHFMFDPVDRFVEEFGRLLERLQKPEDEDAIKGLILDVRENSGGLLGAAERLLQLFTDTPITPLDFEITVSPLAELMTDPDGQGVGRASFRQWHRSVQQALEGSGDFSQPLPLTRSGLANIGRKFRGPVVLVTDGLTYSAGESFAAGFEDHSIGPIIGASDTTGGGGAVFRTHEELVAMQIKGITGLPGKSEPPYMRYALARTKRVGRSSGDIIEDEGVHTPTQYRHPMTERDVRGVNEDLLRFAIDVMLGRREPARETTRPSRVKGIKGINGIKGVTGVGRMGGIGAVS